MWGHEREGTSDGSTAQGAPPLNSYTPRPIQSPLCRAPAAPSPFQVVQLDCSHLPGCSTPAAAVDVRELIAALAQCALLFLLTPFCQSPFSLFRSFHFQYLLWFGLRIWPSTSDSEVGIHSRLHSYKKPPPFFFSPLSLLCRLPGWEQVPLAAWSLSARQNKITLTR